jgi:hypothetical protein
MSEEFGQPRPIQPVPFIISRLPSSRMESTNGAAPSVDSATLADFRQVAENLPDDLLEQAFAVLTEIRRER